MRIAFLIALCCLLLTQAEASPHLAAWRHVAPGEWVYAEVITAPDAVYRQVGTGRDSWIREPNTFLFGQAINVSERHRFLDREHIVRVQVSEDGQWGRIQPDGLHSPYIPDPTAAHPVFIGLEFLRPLPPQSFAPLSVYPDTQAQDKLVVIIRDAHPRLILYEGERIVLHTPVVLGPTRPGDFRVYRTRATDDMPGIPGVPYSNYFSGGFSIHGAPWWNWRETVRGHYGSHGCVNLPDAEWYAIMHDGQATSVAQWVYRWMSTNIDYDESDPTAQEARIGAEQPGWYQATGSVRVLIVPSIDALDQHPLPGLLGPTARGGQITAWEPLSEAYRALEGQWLLTHDDGVQTVDSRQSIAQVEGVSDSDTWIMLECEDPAGWDVPIYEGATRSKGELCDHIRVERQFSICTPERVDTDYFGQRVICRAEPFNLLHIRERGELIEHERIHMIQFQAYFRELHLAGVAIDDVTYFEPSYTQLSSIGVTELMAQTHNTGSQYAEDYTFVLARPDESGGMRLVNRQANTGQAWDHLLAECDLSRAVLEDALMGDADAYQQADAACSAPPHRLVPDRWRLPNSD